MFRFPLTDLGNSQRFIDACCDHLHYIPQWGWLFWNDKYWQRETTQTVLDKAKIVVQRLEAEAEDLAEEEEQARSQLLAHARRTSSASRLHAVIELASSAPCILADPNTFDWDPFKLTVKNGTIDLRTGVRHPHNITDYITHYIPLTYEPDLYSAVWQKFLDDITNHDQALQDYLQRAVGYSLTGQTSEEVFFLLCGPGRNGKSKFLEALGYILGDYVQYAPAHLFMRSNSTRYAPALAALSKTRVVITTEIDATQTLDMTLLKRLTSGEAITNGANGKALPRPHCKLWLATNQLPKVSEQTVAAWQRIKLIPFPVSFVGSEDKQLSEKLKEAAPAILTWAIKGAYLWKQEGLREPACVTEATRAYQGEQDELAGFLSTNCTFGPTQTVKARDLYASYQSWCESNEVAPIAETAFGRQFAQKGYHRKHTEKGKIYIGLTIKKAVA